jgi:hypothetical protein
MFESSRTMLKIIESTNNGRGRIAGTRDREGVRGAHAGTGKQHPVVTAAAKSHGRGAGTGNREEVEVQSETG